MYEKCGGELTKWSDLPPGGGTPEFSIPRALKINLRKSCLNKDFKVFEFLRNDEHLRTQYMDTKLHVNRFIFVSFA